MSKAKSVAGGTQPGALRPREVVALSLSARILVNVEALNMAESVGNVTRHRRVPIVTSSGGKYSLIYVPAVSGESIAHHYQKLLANIATSMGLAVTKMDLDGYYLKFSDNRIIQSLYPEVSKVVQEVDSCKVEAELVKASVVGDVTGFLYTDMLIKRTSRIRFSYLLPTLDAVRAGAAASYPQLHVRYAPPEVVKQQGFQQIYYVETGSALYTLSTALVASDVAELEYCSEKSSDLQKEKVSRVEAALKALVALLDGLAFGAKKSRVNPVWEVQSLVVSVSKGPVEFTVSPAADKSYFKDTVERAAAMVNLFNSSGTKLNISIFKFDKEGLQDPEIQLSSQNPQEPCQSPQVGAPTVTTYKTHTEALRQASLCVLKLIRSDGGQQ